MSAIINKSISQITLIKFPNYSNNQITREFSNCAYIMFSENHPQVLIL